MLLDVSLGIEADFHSETARPQRAAPSYGVDSEYGVLKSVLLATPDHLALVACNSVSNEAIRKGCSSDRLRARKQHEALVSGLRDEGVTVHLASARAELPDMVFTRDTTLMTPWGIVGLSPGAKHRQAEVEVALAAARRAGVPVLGRITRGRIEGGDICLLRPGVVLIGVSGGRTDAEGAEALAEIFRARGWRVMLHHFDPHFLHLDTQFCLVDRTLAAACVDVLDDDFLARMTRMGIEMIPVGYKEARRLGCNVLALGDRRVVTADPAAGINDALRARGYRVHGVDLSEFTMCGGGVHCLTMPLHRLDG